MSASRQRSALPFFAAVLAVLALLPAGWWLFLRSPAPQPAPVAGPDAALLVVATAPAAGPARGEDLRLVEVSGNVEVRKGQGRFVPALLGTVLQADDAVRTQDGRARLVSRDSYDVAVEPGTELEVQELTDRLSRFRLGVGMLVARVEGGSGRRLEVAARGTDAVAAASEGTFAVSSNGSGTVAVGAREGEVELKAAGKAVLLRAGQQAVSVAGKAPSAPVAVPASLFLKVDWPAGQETNRAELQVTGRTSPGAQVSVGGQPLKVEGDGRFRGAVRLREGRNTIEVEGRDVGGHRAGARRELTVDTTAPDSEISTQKLWNP